MSPTDQYAVVIKSYDDRSYVKRFNEESSQDVAESIEKGINLDLNHNEYFTLIEWIQDGIVVDRIDNNF